MRVYGPFTKALSQRVLDGVWQDVIRTKAELGAEVHRSRS